MMMLLHVVKLRLREKITLLGGVDSVSPPENGWVSPFPGGAPSSSPATGSCFFSLFPCLRKGESEPPATLFPKTLLFPFI
ncbi:hypothetical protein CsatA_003624 [Cannabis sativa]